MEVRTIPAARPLAEITSAIGLVLGGNLTQPRVVQGDVSDAGRVGDVGFGTSARGKQAGSRGQGRGHIDRVLAGGGELLGDAATESVGALDGEAPLGPSMRPAGELAARSCVDGEASCCHCLAGGVDRDRGQR